jgi:TonB-linked SusC/RagA family outer membrane protein
MIHNIKIKHLLLGAALMLSTSINAQEPTYSIKGVVLDDNNRPVGDAIITVPGHGLVRCDENGNFEVKEAEKWLQLRIQASGFYTQNLRVIDNAEGVKVYLVPQSKLHYNQTLVEGIFGTNDGVDNTSGIQNIAKKDFGVGAVTVDKALQGKLTGLQLTQKSGMTGEGSLLTMRGVRSLVAENNPLIVINGVPYMPDLNESALVQGYSRSIFQAMNPQDIANVTLLTGAKAAAWGSLGSNGVLLIETDGAKSDDLDTRITFVGSFGLNWQNQKLPLMNASQYKGYMSDIAMDYYGNDMGAFFSDFGFMSSPTANNANLYQFDTDWQDAIYRNSMTHDYLFRVEGGDAIAKYDISLGYTGDQGVMENTSSDRFQAQINANILVGKKWEINANINLAYLTGTYQEQGYSLETNPLFAAYRRSPLLSPYKSNSVPSEDGTYALLNTYNNYYLGACKNTDFIVSNPLSLINDAEGNIRQYDMNARAQLVYNPTKDLHFAVTLGVFSNFDKEKLFVPGNDNMDIVPRFDAYGEIVNSVQVGQSTLLNMFYGLDANYNHTWNRHHTLNINAAMQVITSSIEYDMATGRNTGNDFYQTMGSSQSIGRFFSGYNNKWNWFNGYVSADYTMADYFNVGVIAAIDGASSIGKDASRFHVYPGVHANVMLKNFGFFKNVDILDKFDVFGDVALTGNSRFSSKLGQYYYTSQPYQTIAGIVRANVPNTELKPEQDFTQQVGIDVALLHHRSGARGSFYRTKATNVLMLGTSSSALGSTPYYCNEAGLDSHGFEVSLNLVPIQTRDFKWTIGGTLTTLSNTVDELGGLNNILTTLSDGAEINTMVGHDPYAFYGYQTNGIYATTAEAAESGLTNKNSVAYQAGDVRYVDQNGDHIINDHDKVDLGSATPTLFGSIFTSFEFKGFALDFNFVYSQGNKAYNAVRRLTESTSDFSNQSVSVVRRWQNEGDITEMPRASWGDAIGNNDLSDRFIEDASYLKLRDVTLSYTWNKKLWGFIQNGTIFVSGQNLVCFTGYKGMDPEYAFSNASYMQGVDYGKVALPKSVKIGVNLHF